MIITQSTYNGAFFGRNDVILDFRLSVLARNVRLNICITKKSCETGIIADTYSFQMCVVPITITPNSLYSYVCDLSGLMPLDGCYIYEVTGSALYWTYNSAVSSTLFSFGVLLLNGGVSQSSFSESLLSSHYLNLPATCCWLFTNRKYSNGFSLFSSEYKDFYFATSNNTLRLHPEYFYFKGIRTVDGSDVEESVGTVVKVYEAEVSTFGSFALFRASATGGYLSTRYRFFKIGNTVTNSINYFKVISDPVCESKCILYYRNSLGYIESFLCYGLPTEQSFDFSDNDTFKYINSFGQSDYSYSKPSASESIIINTGYCNMERSRIIKDILLSNECYVLYLSSVRKCKITCSDYVVPLDKTPKNYQLTIDFMSADHCADPPYDNSPLIDAASNVVLIDNIPSIISA